MVWQAGHLLNNGKYEIIEVLGRGGFGLTYKARHRQLAMEVVIKTPDILQKRDTEYEDYVKQFEAEGRKLAKFSQTPHPHIVRVWDIFMEDQVPCLVMDFIQGQTLMEKVKIQGQLSEAECLKYIRQIGSALEAVHQAGMVHRDAHPGNIMIQPNGNAILIDFGIAKEIIPASSSSTDYAANPSFAPYEQIYKGSKANRQPSVDIYALAASFYYAVTGEKPTPSMERRLDNRPLKSPKEINRNLSEHLNTAIILGMALEKGDRPQSMSDWLQKLELPPPAVEPKYRQEKVNPPQAIKTFQVPGEKKQRKVYLVPFIGVCFFYVGIGCILGVNSAPWQGVAVAMAVAVTVPLPVAMAMNVPVGASLTVTMGVSLAVAVAVAVAVATASSISMAPAAGVAISMAIASAWAVPGAVAGAWLLWETSIFDRWKNTAWFDSVKMLIFLFLSGVVSVIALGILSRSILYGIVTGVGGIVILFCQAFAASNLYYGNKKINFFNSFLILSSTNLGGLGSGWLLGFLLHSKG